MNKIISSFVFIVIAATSTGCAFMFNNGRQDVSFTTDPNSADIRNNGAFIGSGKATSSIDLNSPQNITVSNDGYEDGHVYMAKRINPAWLVWDVATCIFPVGLCIPLLVDAVSGSWNGYEDHYAVKLREKGLQAK